MKREHGHRETSSVKAGSSSMTANKEEAGGFDELLVVLGYKVRSSDMADVAHKLEQLEMVLDDGNSHLSDDTVHYNPSDLSGWVDSLLFDLNPTCDQVIPDQDSEYELSAIPGSAAYPRGKRTRTGSDSSTTRSMVVLDSQETGVRLVHALLACAEAVQQNNLKLADVLVKHVGLLASSQAGAMRKVATYFAEGLARRIYRIYPRDDVGLSSFSDTLQIHFYECCPYLKFAHFTANQAILEAFATAEKVHVIDLGINQGLQWPALIQALALRPGGPPDFRLTGIGSSLTGQSIQEVGWKLGQLANAVGVNFEFKCIVLNSLSDLKQEMLEIRTGSESIAVNSVFELHRLLAHPGSIDNILLTIKSIKPDIITVVEQEADHNGAVFLDRFTESLHYYSSLFDSLEGPPSQDRVMSELYLGRQILNLVACEGEDRVERHETLAQWRNRFTMGGFKSVSIGSYAYKQASMLLALYAGADGYKVEENEGCLLLGWQTRPLIATSAWRFNRVPLRNFPDLVSMMAQTKVSLDRISGFLQEEELQEDATIILSQGMSETSVEIKDGCFSWDPSWVRPTLFDIHLEVKRGMRVAVCGVVGSGKSSFLSCILGEIPKISGEVRICGSAAYVSQSAWIQSGNIEENILFGSPMDKAKYKNVIHACSLKRDLELFSHGDQTIIGDRGINLSGGQKQRVQLARALYQDADVYLLDDPFSAVDAHTGSELFKEYILTALADKTVIFVTHQVEFLPTTDLILVLRDGQIIQSGKYEELLQAGTDFLSLVSAHHEAIEAMDIPSHSSEDSDSHHGLDQSLPHNPKSNASSSNIEILAKEVQEGPSGSNQKATKEKKKAKRLRKKQLVQEEERVRGRVSMKVYWSYMAAAYKGLLIPLIIIAQTLFQFLQIASNWWMAWANPQTEGDQAKVSSTVLLLVFIALAFGSSVFIFVRAILVATFGLVAAQKLFLNMLRSVFRAPMSFFDSTPAGRILNRVSIDQSVVDLDIPFRLGGFASTTIQLIGIVGVMTNVTWQVFLLVIPTGIACLWMQKYYMASSRELVRIVSIQKSPIIHLFGESIAGAATIRGFGQEKRFMKRNLYLLDCFARPFFCSIAAIEWLCLRMELLSTFVFAFCMILLVSFPHGTIDPSMAGLAVTYGLNLNARLSRWILSFCKLENKIISIERIYQYSQIPSEAPTFIEDAHPPPSWPENGAIEINNLKVRYGENLPTVLHGVNCVFPGGKKIGIVGRTGSGKSTLIQALFRLIEPYAGQIIIDGIDISSIGLHDLRGRLSIIPQDPTLFEGTIRGNLDPLEEHTDQEVWQALDKSQLGDIVRAKDQKLDTPVLENGDNWSVGQRQLVSLGRALLKQARILVLDEATASVDSATDNLIQKILRTEFGDCTVCTIAHRIPTVIDSDLVLVLSDGLVAEFDTPARLLEDKSSMFLRLVTEYSSRSSGIPDF